MLSNSSSSSVSSVLNHLPADLLSDKEVFLNLLTDESIWQGLSQAKQQELKDKYLPSDFTQNDKEDTIDLLFKRSLSRFNRDALDEVFAKFKLQKMTPEIIRAIEEVKLMKQRLSKLYEQKRQCHLLNEVLEQRYSLMKSSLSLSIDGVIKSKTFCLKRTRLSKIREKAKIRFKKEIKEFDKEYQSGSDDEKAFSSDQISNKCANDKLSIEKNYYELLRKHRRKRKAIENDSSLIEPTLETSNITLNDVISRVTNCTLNSSIMSSTKHPSNILPSNSITKTVQSDSVKKRVKSSNKTNQNTMMSNGHSSSQSPCRIDIESDISNKSDNNDLKNEMDSRSNPSRVSQMTDSNVSYMSSVGTQSPESPIISGPLSVLPPLLSSSPETSPLQLPLEKPPACFFSLLRDIFYMNATNDCKLTLHKLEEFVKEKLRCFEPVTGWAVDMVGSAMNYLSGVLPPPHLIPLVDYKEKNQQWQWIGKDRDSDLDLIPLCDEWIKCRDEDSSMGLMSLSQSIPPAKSITTWTVRPSTEEEKAIYRHQEAIRYNNPNKAFTYRVHGYESVVGPVKGCGIGNCNQNNTSSPNKAREHSLLVNDRPPFVTLLSLVRDSAARLPNGEGTRADICELLKDSQYLLPTISDQQVNGIVSGALDRLHYEKDPCVKYDVNRKVWIYLHRNRSEAEFERLHEVQIAAAKAKRTMNKTARTNRSIGNNIQNNVTKQNQLPIISKTTQQAIHQVVTNILNSEALKVTPNSVPISKPAATRSIATNTNINMIQSKLSSALCGKSSVNPLNTSEESNKIIDEPLTSINGITSTPTTSISTVVSVPNTATESTVQQKIIAPLGQVNAQQITKLANQPNAYKQLILQKQQQQLQMQKQGQQIQLQQAQQTQSAIKQGTIGISQQQQQQTRFQTINKAIQQPQQHPLTTATTSAVKTTASTVASTIPLAIPLAGNQQRITITTTTSSNTSQQQSIITTTALKATTSTNINTGTIPVAVSLTQAQQQQQLNNNNRIIITTSAASTVTTQQASGTQSIFTAASVKPVTNVSGALPVAIPLASGQQRIITTNSSGKPTQQIITRTFLDSVQMAQLLKGQRGIINAQSQQGTTQILYLQQPQQQQQQTQQLQIQNPVILVKTLPTPTTLAQSITIPVSAVTMSGVNIFPAQTKISQQTAPSTSNISLSLNTNTQLRQIQVIKKKPQQIIQQTQQHQQPQIQVQPKQSAVANLEDNKSAK